MRIAYIAPYQGPGLLDRRPIVRNRSLSNRTKIELIAGMLRARAHGVEVISQGEVVDPHLRFFPSFAESDRFHPDIPIHYASVLPIRRVNGFWSDWRTLETFKARHRAAPFDVVIVFNLKGPQVACARHAMRCLGIPVVLEYEDDRFVSVNGESVRGVVSAVQRRSAAGVIKRVSGCVGVSPHLLSQVSDNVPKLLLRGVVGDDVVRAGRDRAGAKKNWVLFSGTHIKSNGVAQLIQAWRDVRHHDWELHITGFGGLTESLRQMASGMDRVAFHGLVSRQELVDLMASARICVNPHELSLTPGNVFAFKIIEYLAAGAHVVTTPMGELEPDVESGITYMPDNDPHTIARTLNCVIESGRWSRGSMQPVWARYGTNTVSASLDALVCEAVRRTACIG